MDLGTLNFKVMLHKKEEKSSLWNSNPATVSLPAELQPLEEKKNIHAQIGNLSCGNVDSVFALHPATRV